MSLAAHNQLLSPPQAERTDVLEMRVIRGVGAGEIDANNAVYPPEAIGLRSVQGGADVTVVGEIALDVDNPARGIKGQAAHAAIIKLVHKEHKQQVFVLQGLETDETGSAKANGRFVRIDHIGIMLGRNAETGKADDKSTPVAAKDLWGEGFKFDETVSRKHVALTDRGSRLFLDETSSNGTLFTGSVNVENDHMAEHTVTAAELARLRNLVNEQGEFGARKVITRDTTVGPKGEATIDIRSWAGGAESIVVDPEKEPGPYQELFNDFMNKVETVRRWGKPPLTEEDILGAIYQAVKERLEYDLEYVDDVSKMMSERKDDDHRKINLSYYLADKKGVCRQMALAAAWLGSEAADQGLLTGRITAEVNQRISDSAAHEWARYTAPSGEVYIIDPAQSYFGRLANNSQQPNRWEYFRPGEKEIYMRNFGGAALTGTYVNIKL